MGWTSVCRSTERPGTGIGRKTCKVLSKQWTQTGTPATSPASGEVRGYLDQADGLNETYSESIFCPYRKSDKVSLSLSFSSFLSCLGVLLKKGEFYPTTYPESLRSRPSARWITQQSRNNYCALNTVLRRLLPARLRYTLPRIPHTGTHVSISSINEPTATFALFASPSISILFVIVSRHHGNLLLRTNG